MYYQRQATFSEAVKSALVENYCNFKGRASRSQYWWYALFTAILGIFIAGLEATGDTGMAIGYIINAALILPGIGLAVRRLHDINKSGWNFLIILIPLVGAILLIVWFCQDSEMRDNEYGPIPLLTER